MTGSEPPAAGSTDAEKIREITEIVLKVIDAKGDEPGPSKGILIRLADGIRAYWPLAAALGSAIIAVVAWVELDVSPLENAREIAHRKQQRQYRQELTDLHVELGNDFLDVGQISAAKVEFTRARELDPASIPAEFGLLKVSVFEPIAAEDFEPELADRRLSAILERAGDDSHVRAFLGHVYLRLDREEAMRHYDRALAIDPDNAWAYYGKGVLYDLERNIPAAIRMYEEASARSPWNQTFLNNLAYQNYLQGKYREAHDLYIKLLTLNGQFLLSYYMLAKTQIRLGDFDTAYGNLQILEALIADPTTLELPRNKGDWFFHRPDKGRIHLDSRAEKAAYAQYLTALAAHIAGDGPEAQRRLSDVSSLADAGSARELIALDVERLKAWRPDLEALLSSFDASIGRE